MRGLLGYTIVGVLVISITLLLNTIYTKSTKFSTKYDNSIVRLHTKDGRFFCSAVIITPNALATAAHCIIIDTPFGAMIDSSMLVEVRAQDGLPTGIFAKFGGVNIRLDTAMLLGDFSAFSFRDIVQSPSEIDSIMMNSDSSIVACGYPLGGVLTCTKVTKVQHFAFWYKAFGWLYPGMSGGPVIDTKTGKVLALNRAVDETGIILTPLIEFFHDMLPNRG